MASLSPPPRPSSSKKNVPAPAGLFTRAATSTDETEDAKKESQAVPQSSFNVKGKSGIGLHKDTGGSHEIKNQLHDITISKDLDFSFQTPANQNAKGFGSNEGIDDDEDREEETVDPEESKRKNDAIRKWLLEQPDPSEYVKNEILRTRRRKDGKSRKEEPGQGAHSNNDEDKKSVNELSKAHDQSASKPILIEPECVMLAKKILQARNQIGSVHTVPDEKLIALETSAIPLIVQAQMDTVNFVLAKRERSGSFAAQGEGDENLDVKYSKNYSATSLLCLNLENPVRRAAIAVVEWIWLEIFMLVTIFVNCILMSLYDPCDNSSRISNVDKTTSFFFIFIYCAECILKIVAMGFITGQYSYLKDNWNKLDFLIVVTGILDVLPIDSISTSFTAFRLLRPLRAIRLLRSFANTTGYLKDLDILVRIVVSSSGLLLHVAMLLGVLILVFGIIGVVLFEGSGRGRCYAIDNGTINTKEGAICSPQLFGSCPLYFACLILGDNVGIFHFDDIGHAALVALQILTMRGWTQTFENTEAGSSRWAILYFLLVLSFGSFFVTKLFLVVLADQYTCIEQETKQSENTTLCLFEVRVGILEAKHLPRMDTFGEADPYVEVRFGNSMKVTSVIKNTLAPEWHEYFTFSVTGLDARLNLTMFDWNRFGSHEFIGKVSIPVGQLDDTDEGTNLWYELEELDSGASNGAIHVILQWRRNASDDWPKSVSAKVFETGVGDAKAQSSSSRIATSKYLSTIIAATTIINVLGLATEHDCKIQDSDDTVCKRIHFGLDVTYIICTMIFLLEIVVKLNAFGFVNYFKDSLNIFNTLIVVFGLAEVPVLVVYSWSCVGPIKRDLSCTSSYPQFPLVFFRLLRILRVFKFAKLMGDLFPVMRKKFEIVKISAVAASSALPVIVLMVLMSAILGMNIFGGFSVEDPHAHWESGTSKLEIGAWTRCMLPDVSSIRTCRIVEINSSSTAQFLLQLYPNYGVYHWAYLKDRDRPIDSYLQNGTASPPTSLIVGLVPRGNFDSFFAATITSFQLITLSDFASVWTSSVQGSGHSTYSIYFASMIFLGHYLVFNLFVAITIQSLAAQNDWQSIDADYIALDEEVDSLPRKGGEESLDPSTFPCDDNEQLDSQSSSTKTKSLFKFIVKRSSVAPETSIPQGDTTPSKENAILPGIPRLQRSQIKRRGSDKFNSQPFALKSLAGSQILPVLTFLCLTASICLMFALQAPSPDFVLLYAGVVVLLNLLLGLEILLQVWLFGHKHYFYSAWNWLEAVLLVIALIYAILKINPADDEFTVAVSILNALQPLRIAKCSSRLKSCINSIIKTCWPALVFVAVLFIPVFIFGLLAVQILSGKMQHCSDAYVFHQKDCSGYDYKSRELREWHHNNLNYDWIGSSLLTIFSLVTLDDWTRVMWSAVDASGDDTGPYANNINTGYMVVMSYCFVIIVITTGLFGMHIFVGVFVDTYKKRLFIQSATECVRNASKRKKSLQTSMKSFTSHVTEEIIDLYEPDTVSNKYRNAVFHFMHDGYFDLAIIGLIIINIVLMPFQTYKASVLQIQFLDYVNFVFCVIFGFETILKIYALYPLQYFESNWNRFDFFVAIVSFVDLLISFQGMALQEGGRIIRIFRMVRVLRAFRIFKISSVFNRIIEVIARSLKNIIELSIVLFLVMAIFGWLCVELYSNMCQEDLTTNRASSTQLLGLVDRCMLVREDLLLSHHWSFQEIGIALLTLLKLTTRDNWEMIAQELSLNLNPRPSGSNATLIARKYLSMYISTKQEEYLNLARAELPSCQSQAELLELDGLIYCGSKNCKSTCGNSIATPLILPLFVCLSSFVILSLVLAILMQSLQEMNTDIQKKQNLANRSSGYKRNLQALMNVNEATVNLRNKINS